MKNNPEEEIEIREKEEDNQKQLMLQNIYKNTINFFKIKRYK